MLKLSVKPGEYLMIGQEIKVIFTGGSGNNFRILVDAPRNVPVVRSRVAEKAGLVHPTAYYREQDLSQEAKLQIEHIISQDRWRARQEMEGSRQKQP